MDLPTKQFALVLDTKLDPWESSTGFRRVEIPVPVLNEKDDIKDALAVLIKVQYAGVCGTDRGIWKRKVFKELICNSLKAENKTTRIVGHEFTGEVVQAGSLVETLYNIKVGNPVSGDSHITCGKCFQCRNGEQHVCWSQQIMGISIDGVFAPYIKLPAKNLWVVDPSRVRPEVSAMYDPFGNAVHATSRVDFRGKRVAIFGCGPIGMFSILLLRVFGAAKIIAIDTNPENLETAKKLGAHEAILIQPKEKTHAYDPDPEVLARVMELTYGMGVDISMEMAGPNSSLSNCIENTRIGGQIILFGLYDGDFVIPKFSRLIVRGITLYSIIGRQIFSTWQTAQRMLSDRTNGIQDKIFDIILKGGNGTIIPFEEYTSEMFEKKMQEHSKLLFKFD